MQVINYHKQVMPHKESKKSIQILPKIYQKFPFASIKITQNLTTKKYARRVLFSKDLVIR